eukprot:scaffold378_cov131-Skeletonema_menzelii.AAC.7
MANAAGMDRRYHYTCSACCLLVRLLATSYIPLFVVGVFRYSRFMLASKKALNGVELKLNQGNR